MTADVIMVAINLGCVAAVFATNILCIHALERLEDSVRRMEADLKGGKNED